MKIMLKIVLSLMVIVVFFNACTDWAPTQESPLVNQKKTIVKRLKELQYSDKGAVVPKPAIVNVSISMVDSLNAALMYTLILRGDTTSAKMPFGNAERLEILHDNLEKLSEIEDGWEVKPGKDPCVGMRGVDVALIFSTGDTARFKISGAARCDRSLIPEWYILDSLATTMFQEYQTANKPIK